MRAILFVCCAGVLSGCASVIAIPPAIQYVSAAATVYSYATTGKGTSDHVISAIAEQDCAMHRAVTLDKICKPGNLPRSLPRRSAGELTAEQHWSDPLGA